MPSQPDTGHVQADESELQATTDTVEPAVRDDPTPQQPVQSTSSSDNTSSFLDKARGFFTRKKRIHRRMRTVIPPPHRKPRRPHRHLTVLSTPRNALMYRYRSIWTKSLNRWKVKNEQTEPSLYKLDGKPAFIDRVNRLEMVNGASNDDRSVLAALAVATDFLWWCH